jgi:hypothetical protein
VVRTALNVQTLAISSGFLGRIKNQTTIKKETLFSERQAKDAIFNDVLVVQR